MVPTARFDDLVAGHSFLLEDYVGELVASTIDEVVGVVAAAQAASEAGRWLAGFVAYEAAPAFDSALSVRPPMDGLPLAWFGVFERRVEVEAPRPQTPPGVDWVADVSAQQHAAAIARIRELIAAGVTYQANLTYRLRGDVSDPVSLYAAMLHGQRPAYGALVRTADHTVVSASPELFFRLDGATVVTRPMKGTTRRGRWPAEDVAQRQWLAGSEKDRAENLMIVDLLRNDLGRIAEFGSVRVDDLFGIERYETVWQMTSTISARRRPGVDIGDVFEALFPCGSVTGAPKASTMAVINDLEESPRGVYCGAIGVIEPGGTAAVFSVPIRTVVVDAAGHAVYGTGGGVTWDSAAAGEWDEAMVKTRVLSAPRPSFRLLETLRLEASGYRALDDHLERLASSARYFGWSLDLDHVLTMLGGIVAEDGPIVVRLTVGPNGDADVAVRPLPSERGPVRLAVDVEPIDRFDPFRFHKTTRREMYERSAARFPLADDVVAVNERGEVVETTIGSIAVSKEGRWVTPPLDAGCLPGIERSNLLADGTFEEGVVTLDDLVSATSIEVVNSVRGRRRAVLLPDPAYL